MVEIVKRGKLKHSRICHECGCEFTFEAEDVTRRTVWDDHGGHYPVADLYSINCPYCHKSMTLITDDELLKEKDKMKHIDD